MVALEFVNKVSPSIIAPFALIVVDSIESILVLCSGSAISMVCAGFLRHVFPRFVRGLCGLGVSMIGRLRCGTSVGRA